MSAHKGTSSRGKVRAPGVGALGVESELLGWEKWGWSSGGRIEHLGWEQWG